MQNPHIASYPQFVPFPAAPPRGAAGSSASHQAPAEADSFGAPAPGGAARGYSQKILHMLTDKVRRLGLSDSAAAAAVGMTPLILSRWKRDFAEVASALGQAREEFREFHLQSVLNHAQADNLRGLRASTWLLERVFPGDYSARMNERFEHRTFEDQRRDREERAIVDEQIRERLEREAAARQAAAAAAQAAAASETNAPASEGVLHNVQNSPAQESVAASERALQNVQNSPARETAAASEGALQNVQNSPARETAPASEKVLQNVQNSTMPEASGPSGSFTPARGTGGPSAP
ncbi:MAG TPA: hypothetical protein VGO11_07815 [Chthoniobacteraceae bacterium]|jgi:hypothetical protein|nr:hypothetical protein [Chthoniobacteraceae bacterium]